MKTMVKYLGSLFLTILLTTGCGGNGSSVQQPGALQAGGAGLTTAQIDNGQGGTITANFTSALDINDSLKVIGFAEVPPGTPFVAALWTVNVEGGASMAPTALASLINGGFAAPFAIDEAGSPVGQADDGARLVAVVWKNGAGLPVPLPPLAAAGNYAAYAVSADGTLIAGEAADTTGATRAVLWTAGLAGAFTTPPTVLPVNIFAGGGTLSPFSSAGGVTRVGAAEILVVGEAEDGNNTTHAALWRSIDNGAGFTPVDLGADHVALAVNSGRQVTGESVLSGTPVSWTIDAQGATSPPVALAAAGSAVAVNENGRIAGWSGISAKATVWNGTTSATLFNTESRAFALNNDIQPLVVGHNGNQGFVKRAN